MNAKPPSMPLYTCISSSHAVRVPCRPTNTPDGYCSFGLGAKPLTSSKRNIRKKN